MRRFEDRTVVVTGRGIRYRPGDGDPVGSEGARVACLDVDEAGAQRTADDHCAGRWCRRSPTGATSAIRSRCAPRPQRLIADIGDPYVLCNMAGVVAAHPLEDMAFAEWQRVIGTNLNGTFLMCQAFMPALKRTGGNIVNTGSRLGVKAALTGPPTARRRAASIC